MKEFSGPLLPLLIELLHENKNSVDPNDLSAVLRKDAGAVSNRDLTYISRKIPETSVIRQ